MLAVGFASIFLSLRANTLVERQTKAMEAQISPVIAFNIRRDPAGKWKRLEISNRGDYEAFRFDCDTVETFMVGGVSIPMGDGSELTLCKASKGLLATIELPTDRLLRKWTEQLSRTIPGCDVYVDVAFRISYVDVIGRWHERAYMVAEWHGFDVSPLEWDAWQRAWSGEGETEPLTPEEAKMQAKVLSWYRQEKSVHPSRTSLPLLEDEPRK